MRLVFIARLFVYIRKKIYTNYLHNDQMFVQFKCILHQDFSVGFIMIKKWITQFELFIHHSDIQYHHEK